MDLGNKLHMKSELKPVFTNVHIFGAIADAAYEKMSEDMDKNVRPNPDGAGVIKTFDPEQTSFKEAMISIVFSCIWLEATLHLLIVRKLGRECFKEADWSTYEKKLQLLGCSDEQLLKNVALLRASRRELIHEKAHKEYNDEGKFTGALKTAQDEAENARAVIIGVRKWCQEAFKFDPL